MNTQKNVKENKHHRNDDVDGAIDAVLEGVVYELKSIMKQNHGDEIDLQRIISESIDSAISANYRDDNYQIISDTEVEENVYYEETMIRRDELSNTLLDMAFQCVEQAIYNNEMIQEISKQINKRDNQDVEPEEAEELLKKIVAYDPSQKPRGPRD